MTNTKSQFLIDQLLKEQMEASSIVKRRGRLMKELTSAVLVIEQEDLSVFTTYRESEYQQYREMIQSQVVRFYNYLRLDMFSRRLLIQFPADWYENKAENYMPCPESFIIFYLNDTQYEIIANFRSSEVSRLSEDIAVIKSLCERELNLSGHALRMKIHCMNLHQYMDEGSSEDFNVTEGYFNKKDGE